MKIVNIEPEIDSWRTAARKLLSESIHPRDIEWSLSGEQDGNEGSDLLGFDEFQSTSSSEMSSGDTKTFYIPKEFVSLASFVAYHSSGQQWATLYDILWRMTHGDRGILSDRTDTAVKLLHKMSSEIRRDMHKMRAFVRFRLMPEEEGVESDGVESYVSWFEPDQHIVRPNAQFFRKRFTNMRWSILTPYECVHWDMKKLTFSKGVKKSEVPVDGDQLEDYWRAYYRNIFNPARVKIKAMCSEMPKKYWKNLPEAEIIEELIEKSHDKVHEMMERQELSVKPIKGNKYLENIQKLNRADGFV